MKADCFCLPVSSMEVSEAASLGAAMLAGIAVGTFKDAVDAAKSMVHIKRTYYPDERQSERYQEKYREYRELYPTLKEFNRLISGSS